MYVANTGNDHASGRSPQTAWRTLAKANVWLTRPHSGGRLLLHGGDTFRDDYLRCEQPDSEADAQSLGGKGACGGSSAAPLVISSYGAGKPVLDGADPLHLPWHPVAPQVWSAPLAHTPAKLFVADDASHSVQLLPVPQAVGSYNPAHTYKFLDLVQNGERVYVHGGLQPTTGTPPSSEETWVGVNHPGAAGGAQGFAVQTSGPENVHSTPGSWYSDGATLWVHLPDGSDPSRHTLAGSYRPYGVLLVSARNVTVQNIAFLHQQASSIYAVAYADAPEKNGTGPNENIQISGNSCAHYGGLVTGRFALRHGVNSLGGCIVVAASGDCHPHLLRGIAVSGNDAGPFDGYLGTGQFMEAGIVISGVDGGGARNIPIVHHNRVHTHTARGITYGNPGLDSCGGEEVRNDGGTVAFNELTDNQGNLFFTQTTGGQVTGNWIHHSFGEGVQSGGNSRSTPSQPQVFDHNVIAFLGRSANGGLYNGFDCNGSPGGVSGAIWRNNTVYDTNSAAITLENGCGSAQVENNIFDMAAPRFPEHDQINHSYLMYFVQASHTPDVVFRNNLWVNGANPEPFHGTGSQYACSDFFTAWPDRNSRCAPDAGFVAPDRGDFHLLPRSIARGKGTDGGDLGALP